MFTSLEAAIKLHVVHPRRRESDAVIADDTMFYNNIVPPEGNVNKFQHFIKFEKHSQSTGKESCCIFIMQKMRHRVHKKYDISKNTAVLLQYRSYPQTLFFLSPPSPYFPVLCLTYNTAAAEIIAYTASKTIAKPYIPPKAQNSAERVRSLPPESAAVRSTYLSRLTPM